MDNENKEQESIENDVNVTVDKSKRKFSKAGMAAPVMMALASRPSWVQAADPNCSFRQALSGNTSQVADPQCIDSRASTVSPGIFRGDGGGDKWADFGVAHMKTWGFSDVFGSIPLMELKDEFTTTIGGVLPDIAGPEGVTTLERALKAIKKDWENGDDFKDNKSLFNQVFHYIGAYLMASSTSSPAEEGGLALVYPYTPKQITDDWGVWVLYPTLQAIQNIHYNVLEANAEVGITL